MGRAIIALKLDCKTLTFEKGFQDDRIAGRLDDRNEERTTFG